MNNGSALEKLCQEVMRLKAEGTPKNPSLVRFEEMEACSAALYFYWKVTPKLARIVERLTGELKKSCRCFPHSEVCAACDLMQEIERIARE
jgi:hypothetical protein